MAKVIEAMLGQAINEWTRTLVEKIPAETLGNIKNMGIDKILPLLSIAFSSIFPPGKSVVSDKLSDFVAEFSAELRRYINEGGDDQKPFEKKDLGNLKGLNKLLLSPQLVDKIADLLKTYSELTEGKSDQEKSNIMELLGQMDQKELYVFLTLEKSIRDHYVQAFLKKPQDKVEINLKESLDKFKASAAQTLKTLHEELASPAVKNFDQLFAPGTALDEAGNKFSKWAKDFRDRARSRS